MRHVYLDHQSATPVSPEVFEAMRPFFSKTFGNLSSLHQSGAHAREAVAAARSQVASFIGAAAEDDIIFTSDGTESANLAVKGVAYGSQRRGNHIVVSQIEHPSLLNSVEFLEKNGFTATRVKVGASGRINLDDVKAAITDKTILVATHLVNHDVGTIQHVQEIGRVAAEAGIAFYVDADAAAGWLPINVQELGANLLSFSPHRFYGPKGVGVLYRNRRARMASLIHGGSQENGWRAGIENVPAIVGAGVAAEIATREGGRWREHCAALQKRLWTALADAIPQLYLNGFKPGPKRVCNNLNFSAESIEGESLVLLCDMQGIAIAGVTNCIGKSLQPSHVFDAMGLPRERAQGAVTLSLGKDNSAEDVDYVVEVMPKLVQKLRAMSPTWEEHKKTAKAPVRNRRPSRL